VNHRTLLVTTTFIESGSGFGKCNLQSENYIENYRLIMKRNVKLFDILIAVDIFKEMCDYDLTAVS